MVLAVATTGLVLGSVGRKGTKGRQKSMARRGRKKTSLMKLHRDGQRRRGDDIEGGRYSYVVIGGLRWQLFSRFSSKKIATDNVKRLKSSGRRFMGAVDDRRNLEQSRASAGIRAVRTNEGWAVVQISPFKAFQIKHTPTLKREQANLSNPIVTANRVTQRQMDRA